VLTRKSKSTTVPQLPQLIINLGDRAAGEMRARRM